MEAARCRVEAARCWVEAAALGVDGDDGCWIEVAGCWVEARSDPPLPYSWSPYVHGDDRCWMEATGSGQRRETPLGLQLSICLLFFAFGARVCIVIIATVEGYSIEGKGVSGV